MSLDQTRKWTCDICGKTETVANGIPGNLKTAVNVRCLERNVEADICRECYVRCFPALNINESSDVPKDEFKKPFWRKFFGLGVKEC